MSITHLYIIPTYRSFVKRFEENAAVGSAALTAVQGRHSLPSPFKSLFFTANKTKNSPMAVFALFGCGGSGARRNDRTVVNKVPFGTLEPYGDRARRREGFEPHVLAFSLRRKCCGQFGGSDLPPAGHSLPPHPPSYSPFGLITLSLRVHTLSQAKQKTARWLFLLCLVIKGRTNLREHEQKLLKILHFYGMTHGFLNLKKEKLP